MKFSRTSSRVKILKCSDISRTNSLPGRVVALPSTLKMGTELVLKMSEHFNILTRLPARENFIESGRENIKTYRLESCKLLLF
jgi:hypothetical protein